MGFLTSAFDVILIILGFGLLIFVHEMGHFLAAKWAGIRTEAFAVGMGPVICSWRKGIGYALGTTDRKVRERTGKPAHELTDEELERYDVGETEYSLRWVPIGGFVKMLGQEDANPAAVSDDPRSYNTCAIGKRMIVVSAGVIMNLLLAAVLFVIAFLIGVPLPAPVIGEVVPGLPAATTVANNAEILGVSTPGLRAGDRIVEIDGKKAQTFSDVQIASAMSLPGVPIDVDVERTGVSEPLEFSITPEMSQGAGMQTIGVVPASSTTLVSGREATFAESYLKQSGLAEQGVLPGMRLTHVSGAPVDTYEQFMEAVQLSEGKPVATTWATVNRRGLIIGEPIRCEVPVHPSYEIFLHGGGAPDKPREMDHGLLGLTPLVRIESVQGGQNQDVLQPGDIVLRIEREEGPRMAAFRRIILENKGGSVDLLVLRDGEETAVTAKVDRKGRINVLPGYAWDMPLVASPLDRVRVGVKPGDDTMTTTPVADLDLFPRSEFVAVGETSIADWSDLWDAVRSQTAAAAGAGEDASIDLTFELPTPERERETVTVALSADEITTLHELGWRTDLESFAFRPLQTIRSAGGNPMRAITMGLEETHKLILLTYLTIDRVLFRRSVSHEQIMGPLGIVHVGSKFVRGGFTYFIFFLALISVNLAVINFLPLPIVDGGLFLFLIYEKIKGRPPSIAFQNAATIAGLFLIGTVFLIVTWNDVMRLIS